MQNTDTTIYNINEEGLLKNIIDAKNIKTEYEHNLKEQITKVKREDKEVTYVYNIQNLLDKIVFDHKTYQFNYDNFLNISNIKINNITLINNNYESNNGNLLSQVYGNGDEIHYTYDDFERLKSVIKENDTYNYQYDNLGNIAKIKTNNDNYKYIYDLSERLNNYTYNNFKLNYQYDQNSNIKDINYKLDNITKSLSYEFNADKNITKSIFNQNEINYLYDDLGRQISFNINNSYNTSYKYYSNGNKTTSLIKSVQNNNDKISYKYDKLNNITHIYQDNTLTNKYFYDNQNELIKEHNYLLNKTYKYTYDYSGNILFKRTYELETDSLKEETKYTYNNPNWEDLLTNYNGIDITYDTIGNPLTIGNKTLSWIKDGSDTYHYSYNKDGIETKYFTNGTDIIFEQTGTDVIYYLRDDNNDLIGLDYNGNIYYF